jgi:hypothetical protein
MWYIYTHTSIHTYIRIYINVGFLALFLLVRPVYRSEVLVRDACMGSCLQTFSCVRKINKNKETKTQKECFFFSSFECLLLIYNTQKKMRSYWKVGMSFAFPYSEAARIRRCWAILLMLWMATMIFLTCREEHCFIIIWWIHMPFLTISFVFPWIWWSDVVVEKL